MGVAEQYFDITLDPNETYTIEDDTRECYGLWIIKEVDQVGAIVLYIAEPKAGRVIESVNNNIIAIESGSVGSGKYSVRITNNDTLKRTFRVKRIA